MFFKNFILLILLLGMTACTNNIQTPLSIEQKQALTLQDASVRGAKHLFKAIEQERGWRTELLPTRILVIPTVQESTQRVVEPSKQIEPHLREQSSTFPKFQLVEKGEAIHGRPHYELHSSLAATLDNGRETITLKMWVREPRSQRVLANASFPIRVETPVIRPALSDNDTPQTWAVALQQASGQLLDTARQDRVWRDQLTTTQVLLAPLFDAYSKENLDLNDDIQAQFQKQAKQYPRLKIAPLSFAGLQQAHYIVHSALAVDKRSGGKHYQLDLWMRDAQNGRLLAHSKSLVSLQGLVYELAAESKDSPVYPETPTPSAGFDLKKELRQGNYRQSLNIDAMLADAAQAYRQGQHDRALETYQTLTGMPKATDNLRTLAGRYMALLRLGRKDEARAAFAELLKSGFSNSSMLTFKILFAVNSTDFAGGDFLTSQYQMWVGELAGYLDQGKQCLQVTGHSSKSGSESYNMKLSADRAARIQQLMTSQKPTTGQRTRTEGKGFHENIIGTGSDDHRDAVDRRVEFRRVACR